jgi:hypothetical protein
VWTIFPVYRMPHVTALHMYEDHEDSFGVGQESGTVATGCNYTQSFLCFEEWVIFPSFCSMLILMVMNQYYSGS